MKNYYRVMLGRKSSLAEQCFSEGYIGIDDDTGDLSAFPTEWRNFRDQAFPIYHAKYPEKAKGAIGLACGMMWNMSKRLQPGDTVISPDGTGRYRVGEVEGDYFHQPNGIIGHRRRIRWRDTYIPRGDMSSSLKGSTGCVHSIVFLTPHAEEIERLIGGGAPSVAIDSSEGAIEDISSFAMEKHLEDFLVQNWPQTELGKEYDIYVEEGERVGQQYPTDTGPLDILAISKDQKTLLVVELKKGRASDAVVGQTLRYMGFVHEELAEENQTVKGVIIALEDDQRIRRALTLQPNITFYRYQISFRLVRG